MSQDTKGLSEDTLKILIATDNHIGYMEKDACRKEDSIRTFEEVLKIGRENDVDFVILGGDLFHDNKPSRNSLHGSINVFRKYCYGDKPCSVAFLSDPAVNFGHTAFKEVNYQDPSINVAMPVFSIHGNHDDPAGQNSLCSLDLLHSAGLLNYFGKVNNLEHISLSPLLLQKGCTRMALYGLGNIRDERLHRVFLQENVKFLRPSGNVDDWFNVFVLHQNRAKHGPKNYIPEQFLDDFLDLIVWGHEHECKVDLSWNGVQNFYITQPGSSIATSLSEGETREKHVGILYVSGKDFKIEKIKLNTVRQFYMEDIVIQDLGILPSHPRSAAKIEAYCVEVVQKYIDMAALERESNPHLPDKPLIRLRIDHSSEDPACPYELFSLPRFVQKFLDKVANPRDMIIFHRKRAHLKKEAEATTTVAGIQVRLETLNCNMIEDMVKQYFDKAEKSFGLSLLTEGGLSDAVKEFVWKDEKEAVTALVQKQLKNTQKHLVGKDTKDVEIEDEVLKLKNDLSALEGGSGNENGGGDGGLDDIEIDGMEDIMPKVERGRGRGRGRGSRAGSWGSKTATNKRKQKVTEEFEDIDEGEEEEELKVTKTKRGQSKSKINLKIDDDDDCFDDTDAVNASRSGKGSQKKNSRGKQIDFESDDDVYIEDDDENSLSDQCSGGIFNKLVANKKKRK